MIFLITVSLSADRLRKDVVTSILYISGNSEHLEMCLHQHNLTILVIWFEYQILEHVLFPSSTGRPKRAHTNDSWIFLGPGQPYINARAINRPNLSKPILFNFLTSCNKVNELLVPCIIFLAAASKYNVKNCLIRPHISDPGSPIKTIRIGLRLDFN